MPINNYDSRNQEQQILDDAVNVSNSASISSTDREVGGWFWNSILGKWLFPGVQQEKEFGQEVAMQREQNRWNSEQERMSRLKEAGVNPLTAAAGLAGSGSAPSVGSPNTAVSSGAEGLSALGSVSSDIGSTVLSSAQRRHLNSQSDLFNAQVRETNELLDFKKGQFAASIAKDLADSGLSKEQSQYWSIKNKYADDSERSDLALKGWSIKKAEKEITLLKDQHKLNLQEWERNVHSIDEMTYRAEKARIEAELMKGVEAIYKKYGIDLTLPENAMLIEAYESGHLDTILEINGKGAYNTSYSIGKGTYRSEMDYASGKSPWELADKYGNRIWDYIKRGLTKSQRDDVKKVNQSIGRNLDLYFRKHPDGVLADGIKHLYELGYSTDDVVRFLESDYYERGGD